MRTTIVAAGLAVAAILSGSGIADAAAPGPVYTCQTVLVDSINRVAGENCTGTPADYQGEGSIKDTDGGSVWRCALLGTGKDEAHPGKLIVVGVFGCEQSGGGAVL
ncbi:hypothetical protein [Streptomyces sp. NPDC088725]|uniref:hypothetical protein n=1 Tax=Streptomyces sp. NPDC088725 TaxID=3365873 RepID=UPI0037FD6993